MNKVGLLSEKDKRVFLLTVPDTDIWKNAVA
jgi:hypothetical protein